MTTKLTPHFTLTEMTFSATAKKFNILNEPTAPQIENLKYLCSEILEPLRSYYEDKPIRVTSGFRSPTLSEKIGSSKNSQHCQGCAVDFTIPGFDNKNVASHIKNNFIFDQLILEYYDENDPLKGWIHVSIVQGDGNRREALTKDREGYKVWK